LQDAFPSETTCPGLNDKVPDPPYCDNPAWATITYEVEECPLAFKATDLVELTPFRGNYPARSSITTHGEFTKIDLVRGKYELRPKTTPEIPPSPSMTKPSNSTENLTPVHIPLHEEPPVMEATAMVPQRPSSPVTKHRTSGFRRRRTTMKNGSHKATARHRADEQARAYDT